ncbi:hypothetical protein BBFL7_02141 [Flavobacteria bacterium BBFL7]|nr:hypothetical protein BBFL7_02141 [Flavobacteria bacterium BBFL7]
MKIFKYLIAFTAVAVLTVSCGDDDDIVGGNPATTDFSGTFIQQDQMGRPGINTVFTPTEADENMFNVTIPANGISMFQPTFQSRIEAYYNAYGATYENNILGLDLPTLTTALALDVLQVSPDAPTSYFSAAGVPLTGRAIEDDVIDVSLILLFGGNTGARFDGNNGTPNLVSDNVAQEAGTSSNTFPYLTAAQF